MRKAFCSYLANEVLLNDDILYLWIDGTPITKDKKAKRGRFKKGTDAKINLNTNSKNITL